MTAITNVQFGGYLKLSTAVSIKFQAKFDDHITPATSVVDGDWTSKRTAKLGTGAWAGLTTTISEDEDGMYQATLASGDVDTLGPVFFKFKAAGVDTVTLRFIVTTDGTESPAAIASTAAAVTALTEDFVIRRNTAQTGVPSSSYITLDAGADSNNATYVGATVYIYSGTCAGQLRTIESYDGSTKRAYVNSTRLWSGNPGNTSVFVILATGNGSMDDYIQGTYSYMPGLDSKTDDILADLVMVKGMNQINYVLDNTVHDSNGTTAARMRIFASGAAATSATDGGSGEGELATFSVTCTFDGVGKINLYKCVQI